jgi:hypothetical protein
VKIYSLGWDVENFRALECDDSSIQFLVENATETRSMKDIWVPFQVWWDEEEIEKAKGDFPLFGSDLIVTQKVLSEFEYVFQRCGELLPLLHEGEDMRFCNITRTIDALDMSQTKGMAFDDGIMWHINWHVFNAESIGDECIFKLPQMRGKHIYVTDEFVRRVKSAELTGLAPVEVWSSDTGAKWIPLWGE